MTEFEWNEKRERAAWLVAEDRLTDEQITRELGIRSRRTLATWKLHPEFRARVQSHVDAFREAIRTKGIAEKQNRIDILVERHRLLEQVRRERAEDPVMRGVPGGSTGLLVRTVKLVKVYEAGEREEIGYVEGDPCPRCGEKEGCTARLHLGTVMDYGTGKEREDLICPLCGVRWQAGLDAGEEIVPKKITLPVEEFVLDAALIREMREHERQAAQELGQWTEKREVQATVESIVTEIEIDRSAGVSRETRDEDPV